MNCDVTCLYCKGSTPNDCLNCSNSSQYFQEGACVDACKEGYYKIDLPNKECIRCPQTCLSCLSESMNDCLICKKDSFFTLLDAQKLTGSCTYQSCPNSLYMEPELLTCVKQCSSNKYYDVTLKFCNLCHATCHTCSGGNYNDCLTCNGSLFLSVSICLSRCPNKFFGDLKTNKCESCPEFCSSCNSSDKCLECSQGYFLNNLNSKCMEKSDSSGEFVDYSKGTIIKCANGCIKCVQFPKCEKCNDTDFYLNNDKICFGKTKVEPILYRDNKTINLFFLTFNDTWQNLFDNLTQNTSSYKVKLKDVDLSLYTINFAYYKINTTFYNWQIIIDFKNDSLKETNLTVTILYPLMETAFKLTKNEVSVIMPPYILKDDGSSSKNQTIINVNPSLSYFSHGKYYFNLSFSGNFSDLFEILPNISSITLRELENKTTYILLKPQIYQIFLI